MRGYDRDSSARDHVEGLIVERLTVRKAGEVEVGPHEFRSMAERLDVVYYRVLDRWHVPGFTEDDLMSFMLMKTHQMLRQGKYDYERPPHSVFYVAMTNLMRDIARAVERAEKAGLRKDPLDTLKGVSAVGGSIEGLDERESHKEWLLGV